MLTQMLFLRPLSLLAAAFFAYPAFAQIPVSAPPESDVKVTLQDAAPVGDPLRKAFTIHGRLSPAGDIDLYRIRPGQSVVIPVELQVPVRTSNTDFRPRLLVMGPGIGVAAEDANVPIAIPATWGVLEFTFESKNPNLVWNPLTLERMMRGRDIRLAPRAGEDYYLLVYEPDGSVGSYALRIGEEGNPHPLKSWRSFVTLTRVKLGLTADNLVPWNEIAGALIMLLGILAGMSTTNSLGAGFLPAVAISSKEPAPRKGAPYVLIGFSILCILAGGYLLYGEAWLSGVATLQAIALIPILVGAITLAASRSSAPRRKMALARLLIIIGLASELILLIWHLIVTR